MTMHLHQVRWSLSEFRELEEEAKTALKVNSAEACWEIRCIVNYLNQTIDALSEISETEQVKGVIKLIQQEEENLYWGLDRRWPNLHGLPSTWIERYGKVTDRLNLLRYAK